MRYLCYRPEIERPEPQEQEIIGGIIRGMTQQSQTAEQREHHAVRASHANPVRLLPTGWKLLRVCRRNWPKGCSPSLAVILWPSASRKAQERRRAIASPRTVACRSRFNDVAGEKLGAHDADTQDFVLASGRTFPSGTEKGFLRDGTVIDKSVGLPEGAKSAVSAVARNFNRLLRALGTDSARADFFGHPFSHPLAESYFS
jgi:hypothetical protein